MLVLCPVCFLFFQQKSLERHIIHKRTYDTVLSTSAPYHVENPATGVPTTSIVSVEDLETTDSMADLGDFPNDVDVHIERMPLVPVEEVI